MTTLVVDELTTSGTLSHTVNLNQQRIYQIEAIKIKILMYNAPSGTFTFTVKDSDSNTLFTDTFDSAELKNDLDTTDDYLYLFKIIDCNNSLVLKSGSYDFELTASGYTYSSGSYLAWIKSHENIFNEVNGTSTSYANNPYDVLIYERVREDLTR